MFVRKYGGKLFLIFEAFFFSFSPGGRSIISPFFCRDLIDKIKKKTRQNSRDITDLQNNNKLLMQHVHWLAEENKKLSDRVLESERRDYNWAMKNSTGDIILPESVPGTVQKRISNKRPR